MANGKLSRRQLAPLVGGGFLRSDAAQSYNAFSHWLRANGHSGLTNAGSASTYRALGNPADYARGGPFTQWFAWKRYQAGGNLAAQPGTSNHGLGLAVDFSGQSIQNVAKYGPQFGWRKTEAFSEPWHYCYVPGAYAMVREWSGSRAGDVLKSGSRGTGVVRLKQLLRIKGYWPRPLAINDGFGPVTARQVRKFQQSRRLKADGIVGGSTWIALKRR